MLILFFVIELIINDNAIVPADLRSAGIKYKDLLIRLKYRCFTKVRNGGYCQCIAIDNNQQGYCAG